MRRIFGPFDSFSQLNLFSDSLFHQIVKQTLKAIHGMGWRDKDGEINVIKGVFVSIVAGIFSCLN